MVVKNSHQTELEELEKKLIGENNNCKKQLEEVEIELKKVLQINLENEEKRLKDQILLEQSKKEHKNAILLIENASIVKLEESLKKCKSELEAEFDKERVAKASSLTQLMQENEKLREDTNREARSVFDAQEKRLIAESNGEILVKRDGGWENEEEGCLSVCVSLRLSVCLCACVCVPVCASICVCVCLCVCLSVCQSNCLYITSFSIHLFLSSFLPLLFFLHFIEKIQKVEASLSSAEQVAAKQLLEREEQIHMEYKTKILDNENAFTVQLQKELNDLKISMEKQSTVNIEILLKFLICLLNS